MTRRGAIDPRASRRREVHAVRTSVVVCALLLVSKPLLAEQGPDTAATGSEAARVSSTIELTAAAPAAVNPEVADVVLVGSVRHATELKKLVEQLLAAEGVTAHFTASDAVRVADLLGSPPVTGVSRPCIWITRPRPNMMRLFLADGERIRYLVRDVPLRSGLDALGSELTAQVVESSATALLLKHEGMTRTGLRTRLREEARAQTRRRSSPSPRRAFRAEQRAERRARVAPRVDAGYLALWTGRQFGVMHGPALRAGAQWMTAPVAWSALLAAERAFRQSHAASDLEIRIQTTAARLLMGGQWPVGPSFDLTTLAGAGLDVTRVTPRDPESSDIGLAQQRTNLVGWVRLEMGPEWHTSALGVRLAAVADVSLDRTSYVLEEGRTRHELARPSVVRFGLLLSVAWRSGQATERQGPSSRRRAAVSIGRGASRLAYIRVHQ